MQRWIEAIDLKALGAESSGFEEEAWMRVVESFVPAVEQKKRLSSTSVLGADAQQIPTSEFGLELRNCNENRGA